MSRDVKWGPTNLDVECKQALQQILKPVHYQVVHPWMQCVGDGAKRDMVKLVRLLEDCDAELKDQRLGYLAASEPTTVNRNGRVRATREVPITADRAQQDLLRNRHGADQRDERVQAARSYFQSFAPVPSTASVDTFHRLRSLPVASDASTAILTERARRQLQRWQVFGPGRSPQDSAMVMRSLASLSMAVAGLPNYQDHSRDDHRNREAVLYEYSRVAPRGVKPLSDSVDRQLRPSASAPALLPLVRPLLSTEVVESIRRPGGDVTRLSDDVPLQKLKNKERATRSKIPLGGGDSDWSTTYAQMAGW